MASGMDELWLNVPAMSHTSSANAPTNKKMASAASSALPRWVLEFKNMYESFPVFSCETCPIY